MSNRPVRLATRAIIVVKERLLLVNAYAHTDALWCAPGGGVEPHQSLPDNLKREVYEETGLGIEVGDLTLVNEFHAPDTGFHQIDLFFRCCVTSGAVSDRWTDPEGVVKTRAFFTRDELDGLLLRPKSLPDVAFSNDATVLYDPLEPILKL